MPRNKQHAITPNNLGETFKKLREEQGLTQAQLCEKTGLSVPSIRGIENNYGHSPKFENVHALASALGYKVVLE